MQFVTSSEVSSSERVVSFPVLVNHSRPARQLPGPQNGFCLCPTQTPRFLAVRLQSNVSMTRATPRAEKLPHASMCSPWSLSSVRDSLELGTTWSALGGCKGGTDVTWPIVERAGCSERWNMAWRRSRPWRPIGLWDVEVPTLSRQLAHRWPDGHRLAQDVS
jgi:hypothetical protein